MVFFLLVVGVVLTTSSLALAAVQVLPSSTTLEYTTTGQPTTATTLQLAVTDTAVMGFEFDLFYNPAQLSFDTAAMVAGTFLTSNLGGDTYFFLQTNSETLGMAVVTACRIVTNGKALSGTQAVFLNLRFVLKEPAPSDSIHLTNFRIADSGPVLISPADSDVYLLLTTQVAYFLMRAVPAFGISSSESFTLTVVAYNNSGETAAGYSGPALLSVDTGQIYAGAETQQIADFTGGIASESVGIIFNGDSTLFTITVVDAHDTSDTGELRLNAIELATSLSLEGRADSDWAGGSVRLINNVTGESMTAVSSGTGVVFFAAVPDGVYTLVASDTRTITKVISGITLSYGQLIGGPLVVGVLTTGDVNQDNAINDFDHVLIIDLIKVSGYNSQMDLNNDGNVDMNDLILQMNNYGRRGENP